MLDGAMGLSQAPPKCVSRSDRADPVPQHEGSGTHSYVATQAWDDDSKSVGRSEDFN